MQIVSGKHSIAKAISATFLRDESSPDREPQSPIEPEKLPEAMQLLWKNLEFASQHPPANQGTGCLGRLDYCEIQANGSVVVRGWVFHKTLQIRHLFLSSPAITVRAYACELERSDVRDVFISFPQAGKCGFVATLPPTAASSQMQINSLSFYAKMEDDTSRQGTLQIL